MTNPWQEISLSDYENHMSLASVAQLQALNRLMRGQLSTYPVDSVLILGVAGGNGLEHADPAKYRAVYGVDINPDYLAAVRKRYPQLSSVLRLLELDLIREAERLPQAELLIADLLVEYVGYDVFRRCLLAAAPAYVSCVIQINGEGPDWVSDSPYLHAFDGLEAVHHQMEESRLAALLEEEGFRPLLREEAPLRGGKKLLRLDFRRAE